MIYMTCALIKNFFSSATSVTNLQNFNPSSFRNNQEPCFHQFMKIYKKPEISLLRYDNISYKSENVIENSKISRYIALK